MILSIFPFLTRNEFSQSCKAFADHVQAYDGRLSSLGWVDVTFDQEAQEPVMTVRTSLDSNAVEPDKSSLIEGENTDTIDDGFVEPDDPEELIRQPALGRRYGVEYNILLSPTYQVPVLYFFLKDGSPCTPKELDRVYDLLIPAHYRPGLREVGVMGGISITESGGSCGQKFKNHPTTGIPVYFVHPCATSDALKSVARNKEQTTETYLLLWLGLIGNCVGLNVPSELVA